MKIRQTFLHALLALLLLLSQQMGVAHAVSHLAPDDYQEKSQDKRLPNEKPCDQCIAFAHLDSALANPPFGFFAGHADNAAPIVEPRVTHVRRIVVAFRSRAPPATA
ncbi:MAG TPA: hypothetical protein VHK70_08225 [Burkholderiaceae bacterium]|nr:hypothetical protein [Burkholderiaceae bacterium]